MVKFKDVFKLGVCPASVPSIYLLINLYQPLISKMNIRPNESDFIDLVWLSEVWIT